MTRVAITAGALFSLAAIAMSAVSTPAADGGPIVARARFTPDGRAELPVGYRQWSLVGTRVKLSGINIFDGFPRKCSDFWMSESG